MAACNNCQWYSEDYDRLGQARDDRIIIGEQPGRQKHYCVNYDGSIPAEIFYQGAPCEWYSKKMNNPVRIYGKTPSGGDYSEAFYLDKDHNLVAQEDATEIIINECLEDGTVISTTYGKTGRG